MELLFSGGHVDCVYIHVHVTSHNYYNIPIPVILLLLLYCYAIVVICLDKSVLNYYSTIFASVRRKRYCEIKVTLIECIRVETHETNYSNIADICINELKYVLFIILLLIYLCNLFTLLLK